MGTIVRTGQAGSLESGDIKVLISFGEEGQGLSIELESLVMLQYGDAIRATVLQEIAKTGLQDAKVKLIDRGALDCAIRARVRTAMARAGVDGVEC